MSRFLLLGTFILLSNVASAQLKNYELTVNGDTINGYNSNNQKQGKWVIEVAELRGEPGFEEEGVFHKGQKVGYWRQYNSQGDLVGVEFYQFGGKQGTQRYFNDAGTLIREESWRAYNPDAPYDTIAVYGTGSNDIMGFKIVKAETYSVKEGEWKFYDPETGELKRKEVWERNNLVSKPANDPASARYQKSKNVEKTEEMKKWDEKNSGKKRAFRDGSTSF